MKSKSKETILATIRKALHEVPQEEQPEDVEVSRTYRQKGDRTNEAIVQAFAQRVGEYKATVQRVDKHDLSAIILESCNREEVKNLVVPDGFPKEYLPEAVNTLYDDKKSPLTRHELDQSDGVITTCALGIAQTGTIILDAKPGQGRRVLTLLPDYHLCIVREDQIVDLLPEGFTHVQSAIEREGRPITFISGPSATSDIELSRVEGVHGPRRLEILITDYIT